MTILHDLINEAESLGPRHDAWDVVRRRRLAKLHALTGRDLILYATDFIAMNPVKAQAVQGQTTITLADKDALHTVMRSLEGPNLDVMLHSPGGMAEAAESIVAMIRGKYKHVRFIIPNAAKSAATLIAMSGDELLMDSRSELGPTDPQFQFVRDGRLVVSPAQAIKDQFAQAQKDINADPKKIPSWVPILREYGPSLLAQCDNALDLSVQLVTDWLSTYMFAGQSDAKDKATRVAVALGSHNDHKSHARRVGIEKAQEWGLNVTDMDTDPPLSQAVAELYQATMQTFENTGAYRIFENHKGEAFISAVQITRVQAPQTVQGKQVASPRKQGRPPKSRRRR